MINKVILIGNLGKDPETKTLDNGTELARFSLATSENYKDKNGEWQQKTEWHNITAWGNLAGRAFKLAKGDMIYLEGKLQTRSWQDKDGNKRYSTEINCSYFRKLNKAEAKDWTYPKDEAIESGKGDVPF